MKIGIKITVVIFHIGAAIFLIGLNKYNINYIMYAEYVKFLKNNRIIFCCKN